MGAVDPQAWVVGEEEVETWATATACWAQDATGRGMATEVIDMAAAV